MAKKSARAQELLKWLKTLANLMSTFDNDSAIPQATKPFASQWKQIKMTVLRIDVRAQCRQLVGGVNMPLSRTIITALNTEQTSATEDQ